MTMPPMPDYTPPAAAARPARPGVVTLAGYLMFVLAALQVLGILLSLPTFGAMQDVYEEAFRGTEMEGTEGAIVGIALAIGIGTAVLFAIGLVVLGILDLKGKQPARIVTWVVVGLLLCCSGGSLAGSGLSSNSFGGGGNTGNLSAEEIQKRIEDAIPSWQAPVSMASAALQLLLAIAVVVLLALPAAHPYFRKPEPQWTPPAYPTA
ncbi:MAG: hypothetical protein HOV79_08125 [Hamadaea sp.]|nr:hypothetical protein [Hamadaea sp.]